MSPKARSPEEEAVKLARETFGKMRDIDFFSDRVKHLYFYGPVTRESVLTLKTQIREANRNTVLPPIETTSSVPADPIITSPLPIVVHVNSFGGNAHAMSVIFAAFLESKMPICSMIDGVSASASTTLSAGAPYRVVAPSSGSLFHEWSISFGEDESMRKPDLEILLDEMAVHEREYHELMHKRSKMSKEDLDQLVKRDLFLSATQCIKKGFADRILTFGQKSGKSGKSGNKPSHTMEDVRNLLRDASINHITVTPYSVPDGSGEGVNVVNPIVLEFDNVLQHFDGRSGHPIVIHFSQGYSDDSNHHMVHSFYGQTVPFLTRVRAAASAPSGVIGVVDSIIDVVSAIPFLHCNVRAMYKSAIFVIHLVYGRSNSKMIDDIIDNTNTAMLEIRKILTQRTRIPKKIIDNMHRTRIVLNAHQCLEYGIVDLVL